MRKATETEAQQPTTLLAHQSKGEGTPVTVSVIHAVWALGDGLGVFLDVFVQIVVKDGGAFYWREREREREGGGGGGGEGIEVRDGASLISTITHTVMKLKKRTY